jgi:hypothetical protein
MRIGIVGGTGREGKGLALRWARAGHTVKIGSRDAERARARAAELGAGIEGGDNAWCVADADAVLLSVPYAAHAETLKGLAAALEGRVLIDITVPLKPPKVSQVNLPEGRAAALEAQAILGAGTRVVAALHHVSSAHLGEPDHSIECDVLLCGDDEAAKTLVIGLIQDLGLRALDAGPLQNAVALESLTPVLLFLNKKYKGTAGIRFTGLP